MVMTNHTLNKLLFGVIERAFSLIWFTAESGKDLVRRVNQGVNECD